MWNISPTANVAAAVTRVSRLALKADLRILAFIDKATIEFEMACVMATRATESRRAGILDRIRKGKIAMKAPRR